MLALIGLFMRDRYHGRYYAKAQNLARSLRWPMTRRCVARIFW